MQVAFGLEQLNRLVDLPVYVEKIFKCLYSFSKILRSILFFEGNAEDIYKLACVSANKRGAPFSRNALVTYLEDHKIQTRPLFQRHNRTARICKIPYRKIGTFKNAKTIMKNSLVGLHHGLTKWLII